MTTLQLRAFREALKNYNAETRKNLKAPGLGAGNQAWNNYYRSEANLLKEINRKRAIVRRIGNRIGMTVYRNTNPYNERRRKDAARRYLGSLISRHANKARLGRIFHGMAISRVQAHALRNLPELQRNLASLR